LAGSETCSSSSVSRSVSWREEDDEKNDLMLFLFCGRRWDIPFTFQLMISKRVLIAFCEPLPTDSDLVISGEEAVRSGSGWSFCRRGGGLISLSSARERFLGREGIFDGDAGGY
jgi:hypothetical protein